MKIVTNIKTVQQLICRAKLKKKRIGFVPTMGYLHEGHAALLKKCRQENDLSILSIFVNPKQFAPGEDLSRYPRDNKKDELLAKRTKVDIIFRPSEKEMYPTDYLTTVDVAKMTEGLCGRFRPGHFTGVTTVVAKLLNIVSPDVLYLGQKDAQQAAVIQRMILDLNFPVKVKVLPTVREKDGLALSSRNVYLTPEERSEAPILFKSLRKAKEQILAEERKAADIIAIMTNMITEQSSARIEYIECVDQQTLQPVQILKGNILIALAVYFGKARLIDNIMIQVR